jgi:hypothetical protein
MIEPRPSRLTAIIPCSELDAAETWWNRLGFRRRGDQHRSDYRMLSDGSGCELHLTAVVEDWLVPGRNPFGVYLYTARVDELAVLMQPEILEPGRRPEHKPWGMYEFALNGPDDLLVRIGWPDPAPASEG